MAKRRVEDDSDIDVSSTDSEEEIEQEVVNVDFDYFDLNPDVDFQATKTFLNQLLGDDCNMFDISGLADLILTKNAIGTAIKTEGTESDPFALLTVINLNQNLQKPAIKTLVDYIFDKTSKQIEFNMMLKKLLSTKKTTKDSSKQPKVGLIISERMINMPVEVVPPMYKMLLEEMNKAEDSHEKYEFDYFLIISKVYDMVAAKEEEDDQKSKKKKVGQPEHQTDYFHYEDIVLEENARFHGRYRYTQTKQDTDSRRVFTEYGIDPKLSLILMEKSKLAKSVPEMEEKFPPF